MADEYVFLLAYDKAWRGNLEVLALAGAHDPHVVTLLNRGGKGPTIFSRFAAEHWQALLRTDLVGAVPSGAGQPSGTIKCSKPGKNTALPIILNAARADASKGILVGIRGGRTQGATGDHDEFQWISRVPHNRIKFNSG